jgi:uncharacterized protein YjiS (DUF1127 family)
MATITTNPSARDSLFAHAGAFFSGMLNSAIRHRLYRTTLTELSALTSRELDDLGMARGDIKSAARKAVYGL